MTGLSVSLDINRVHGDKKTDSEGARRTPPMVSLTPSAHVMKSNCHIDIFSSTVAANRRRLNRGN